MFRISEEPIVPGDLVRAVSGEEVGGIATFFGTVRILNAGKRVVAVEYQAYPSMAEKVLDGIGLEMRRGFGALRIALVHRIGRLGIGEVSVGIAAGAPHRHEALGAVGYGIERIKQALPVWKREIYEDGSAWLETVLFPTSGEPD
jgi:molybdopterin synthase catalytic subunit